MKKYNLLMLSVFIFSVFFTGCIGNNNSDKKINEIYPFKNSEIKKVIFYDGRGGRNKPLPIQNKKNIAQFMSYIDGYVVRKQKNYMPATGWSQKAIFYNDKNNKILDITFGNPIVLNGQGYDVLKNNLSTQKIDSFLKSINPSWKSSGKLNGKI